MHRPGLERLSLDLDLMVARRRADACTPGSPSWDAAMGLVQELEETMRQLDDADAPDAGDEREFLAQACT